MTPDDFRRIALSQPGAIEKSHRGHPDFRAGGKIFATVSYPDDTRGMVQLDPEEQRIFVQRAPDVFRAVPGYWGEHGATHVFLANADADLVAEAMASAFRRVTTKAPRSKRSRL